MDERIQTLQTAVIDPHKGPDPRDGNFHELLPPELPEPLTSHQEAFLAAHDPEDIIDAVADEAAGSTAYATPPQDRRSHSHI